MITMNVLVVAASKHGGTEGIAEAIGEALEDAGLHTLVARPQDIHTLTPFDAVLIGSAVYYGRWMEAARTFIDDYQARLQQLPVWLFSSGPVGEPPRPMTDPGEIPELIERTHARGHRLFAGAVERRRLGLTDRTVATAMRVPDGDFRSWSEVRGWAREIASALTFGDVPAEGGEAPRA
jgi:menaquinone-dependent protoporphyrinogen oxidase